MKKIEAGAAEKFVILTGDLGFSVLEPLREKLGPRFINFGINESLMTSAAAGIASEGFKVFTYSITPFATFRCLEQIRNDVCYHEMDVCVVGIGAGYGYGSLGPTHHALEDLAAMWSLPNMSVFCPADLNEAESCFEKNWTMKGPRYLRIGKGGEGKLSEVSLPQLPIIEYKKGADLTLLSTGHILEEVLGAQALLLEKGIHAQVLSCPVLKPFPVTELRTMVSSAKVLCIEELNPYGGFSGEAAKALSGTQVKNFKALSSKDSFAEVVGSSKFQRSWAGIDRANIIKTALELLNGK